MTHGRSPKPDFNFGDLVSVDGYHGAVFQVEAYRREEFHSLTYQSTDHIYEVVDVQTDAYIEADEQELTLLAPADQADEYIQALPKREITDGMYGFNFGLSADYIDEALKHYREGEAFNMFGGFGANKPQEPRKPTARELSGQEAERRKKARKERAEEIDNLLDIASWNRKMYEKTGEESYGDALFAVEAKLFEMTTKEGE